MRATPFTPILQFGTSRFLQAHADLFISQALEKGEALGRITVVQTTGSADSAQRVQALASGVGYPVRIQGAENGRTVDEEHWSTSIAGALQAGPDWALIRQAIRHDVQVVISNTGDTGYVLDPADTASCLAAEVPAPRSFPAKLLVLLHDRWQANPDAPLSLFPCELVSRNGDVLRDLIIELAAEWGIDTGFAHYLRDTCRWANSLVDRIVSQPIQPVGAIAEPYAIWAIERQSGLVLPCTHPCVVVTDQLEQYEQFKLFMLNLGHTWLAERWLKDGRAEGETVFQAMNDPLLRGSLENVWEREVLPVFAAKGQRDPARDYLASVRDRFLNPFLQHRIADIAQNHEEKKRRRFLPVVEMGRVIAGLEQPKLEGALAVIPD
ncbi:mannitol dehydrogenase family protein [Pseudomonas petrae]|uniref:Mannitol dehydrogenase family protein n=1 Tax=Pseudomonas petrae TaxID=2912190 RepID=A0ABS9IDI0_9PSED|nr:mannitol dehydrogenase family protein [Pseudomonas petrae]MCF7532888.1 mannitol dehydrogenase family protein [Pseudomonas petrae]MCF7535755.1 mannitol dehydrogenase family protein [Pseudomonas petrae]MCF7545459.1 mannitol dehydrogenase family protein [Pseudomonas petrae]MCF7554818.1 mannitol dehydrogenase family protein [Pseudomonas petrae]